MGKPHKYTVDYLTRLLSCKKEELCFIGDRLETDILIGQANGIPSVLVLSGVTSPEQYNKKSDIRASEVVGSLKELAALL